MKIFNINLQPQSPKSPCNVHLLMQARPEISSKRLKLNDAKFSALQPKSELIVSCDSAHLHCCSASSASTVIR